MACDDRLQDHLDRCLYHQEALERASVTFLVVLREDRTHAEVLSKLQELVWERERRGAKIPAFVSLALKVQESYLPYQERPNG